jgi:hypothetical protein
MRPGDPNQILRPHRHARVSRRAQPVSHVARCVAPGEARKEAANRHGGTRARQAPATADAVLAGRHVAHLGTQLDAKCAPRHRDRPPDPGLRPYLTMLLRRMSVTHRIRCRDGTRPRPGPPVAGYSHYRLPVSCAVLPPSWILSQTADLPSPGWPTCRVLGTLLLSLLPGDVALARRTARVSVCCMPCTCSS